jgi:phage shock protein C
MERRLFRSRSNYMLGGVCGGLGIYLGIDPSLVRLFFILLTVAGAAGVPIYIILWIVLPREDKLTEPPVALTGDEFGRRARLMGDEMRDSFTGPNPKGRMWVGIALLVIGGILLLREVLPQLFYWLNTGTIWAVLLILGGVFLLLRSTRK